MHPLQIEVDREEGVGLLASVPKKKPSARSKPSRYRADMIESGEELAEA